MEGPRRQGEHRCRMRTLLTHATLIDCVKPIAQPDCSVLLEEGRIQAIFPAGDAPPVDYAEVIDLRGAWLMPEI